MNVIIKYRTHDGEEVTTGVDNIHDGQPFAEAIRSALGVVPDDAIALELHADGEQVL